MSAKPHASGAAAAAQRLFAALIAQGLTDAVVCPGSRSQSLALQAAAHETAGELRLHVRTDERSAAYLALGIAKESQRPVAVIVTSGTAVANLLPAVMEAAESRAPLLLITADRPPELHHIRANQTASQSGIFDIYAALAIDLDVPAHSAPAQSDFDQLAAKLWARAAYGPVHLNLRLRDPLSGQPAAETTASNTLTVHEPAPAANKADQLGLRRETTTEMRPELDTVVLAGSGAGAAAEEFAHAAGLPLLAEVVSGARYGRNVINCYQTLLGDPATRDAIKQVVVFGAPTLNREIPLLLQQQHVQVTVVDAPGHAQTYLPPGVIDIQLQERVRVTERVTLPAGYDPSSQRPWLGSWLQADRELLADRSTVHAPDTALARETGYKERNKYARQELAAKREKLTREMLVEGVWRAGWPHDRLVVSASRLVRVLDHTVAGRPIRVHANRGVAGIDGTIATALGVAIAAQDSDDAAAAAGVTRLLIGDLAFLHDVGSLALTPGESAPRIQVFIANDNGGTIFDSLEVRQSADPDAYERVMRTPQQVQIAELAAAYGWEYHRLQTRGELEDFLTAPVSGPQIIEVRLEA